MTSVFFCFIVNHRRLIDNGWAQNNGNDLRIYYFPNNRCHAKQLDRIVQNLGTSQATLLFKTQELFDSSINKESHYILLYDNPNAEPAKSDPENVYLFHDDFSSQSLEKQKNSSWGSAKVVNGLLEIETNFSPKVNDAGVVLYAKHGYDWQDVNVELDMMETTLNSYLGIFVRVQNPTISETTAWGFYFHSGETRCVFRPTVKNRDASQMNKARLHEPLAIKTWIKVQYKLVDNSFSHWVNGNLIHNDIVVEQAWMIPKGSLGFGCQNEDYSGCHTYYDNIRITKYLLQMPTLSLGRECTVDENHFLGLGASEKNPATSWKQIHDVSLHQGKHRLNNSVYWITTSPGWSAPTYCDLRNGGWTLVGKISGYVGNIYETWLIRNQNVKYFTSPSLSEANKMGCIDARYLATNHASTVMIASGDVNGIGTKWVRWTLSAGRIADTLWTHSVSRTIVSQAKMEQVSVISNTGDEQVE